DGRSEAKAFLTIQRGVEPLKAGDTLIVGPGVYHEEVFIEKSGTPDSPITIRSQYPHQARLEGSVRLTNWRRASGMSNVFAASLDRPTYLVYEKDTDTEYREVANLRTLERTAGSFLYDASEKALYVHPTDNAGMAHHAVDACVFDYGLASKTTKEGWDHSPRRVGLVIEGLVASGYNLYGIYLHNADYCEVRRCIVHHTRRGLNIYEALRSRIADCEAFANADRFNREMGNIAMMSYVAECVMERNVIYNTRQHGIRFYGGSYGNVMRGNLAYDCNIGIHVKGQSFTAEDGDRYFRFSDNGKPSIRRGLENVFEGNVALRTRSAALIPNFCAFRRNTGIPVSAGKSPAAMLNLALLEEETAKAKFADPAYHDLRLQSDSPFRSAGPEGASLGALPYKDEVFFVSPQGNDANAGTSIAAAWKTLAHATTKLKAGQTLYALPGTYTEPLALKGLKSADGQTILRAHGRGVVILDGHGLSVRDCQNVLIQGFRVRGATEAAVRGEDSAGVEIRENEVYDNKGDGIRLSGACADARIIGNTVCFNRGAGVKLAAKAERAEVLSNIVRDNGVQLALADGLPPALFCDHNDLGGKGVVAQVGGKAYSDLASWRSASAADAHSIDADPGFVNAAARDFTLQPTSLCRGRGFLDKPIGVGRVAEKAAAGAQFVDVKVVATSPTSADLAWRTAAGPTTALIAYGTQPDKLDQLLVKDTGHYYRQEHHITLTGLKPGARYFFRVGDRQLLDGDSPFHYYNYSWPERTPQGEEEHYETLRKKDTFDTRTYEFTTQPPAGSKPAGGSQVYHVSPSGRDDASGSADAPFRNIERACELVRPGDRVVVHEGTYFEMIRPLRSGLPGQPITFEAARGERVVLNGKGELIPTGADLLSRHHVVVRGFFFHGQSEVFGEGAPSGHVFIVDASNVLVEQCVFDGRMNYLNSAYVWRSKDVTLRNNLFVSHHSSIIATDNLGTLDVQHNSFIGPTIHRLYGVRNERVVFRNNLLGENLFPKKKQQYKVVVADNAAVDSDYNCYYFDPANDERRMVDFGAKGIDLAKVTALPEQMQDRLRVGIKGTLDVWQRQFGQDKHSFIADPKWKSPELIKQLESRPRNWPNRFIEYPPFTRADLALAPDSPCRGAGEGGSNIGADYAY
ncbi:MAG: DUF1565 domain-containing protein, partial [Planctomycetes bacterium]|nr:DUF1565 domain-containing protein [Planctomycetota bacterium]